MAAVVREAGCKRDDGLSVRQTLYPGVLSEVLKPTFNRVVRLEQYTRAPKHRVPLVSRSTTGYIPVSVEAFKARRLTHANAAKKISKMGSQR